LHIIKLCVGVDSVEQLATWQAERLNSLREAGSAPELAHRTRQMPRQRAAILAGGSIYWVIKGIIQARQKILDLREEIAPEGHSLCAIVLAETLMTVKPQPRRPFQGWRYLASEDAPSDIGPAGTLGEDIPAAMRAALAELALL
jgi:hypothetical protein